MDRILNLMIHEIRKRYKQYEINIKTDKKGYLEKVIIKTEKYFPISLYFEENQFIKTNLTDFLNQEKSFLENLRLELDLNEKYVKLTKDDYDLL